MSTLASELHDHTIRNDPQSARNRRWSWAGQDVRGRSPRRSAGSPSSRPPDAVESGYVAFTFAAALIDAAGWLIGYLVATGVGVWGIQQPGRLGLADRQLRVLGRYRPRRHADFGDSVPVPPEVADLDQPLRRGDDDLRGDVRGHFPAHPRRPRLGAPTGWSRFPNQMQHLAELPQPAAVGRVRGLAPTPRCRCCSGTSGMIPDLATLRDRAEDQDPADGCTGIFAPRAGAGRRRHWRHYETAYLMLAGLATPLVLSVHSVVSLRLRGRACCPAGTRRSSRPTSSPARSSRGFAMVLTLMIPARWLLRPGGPHHDQAPREHEQDHPGDRLDRRLRLRDRVLHRLVLGQPVRAVHLHQPRLRPVCAGPTG